MYLFLIKMRVLLTMFFKFFPSVHRIPCFIFHLLNTLHVCLITTSLPHPSTYCDIKLSCTCQRYIRCGYKKNEKY